MKISQQVSVLNLLLLASAALCSSGASAADQNNNRKSPRSISAFGSGSSSSSKSKPTAAEQQDVSSFLNRLLGLDSASAEEQKTFSEKTLYFYRFLSSNLSNIGRSSSEENDASNDNNNPNSSSNIKTSPPKKSLFRKNSVPVSSGADTACDYDDPAMLKYCPPVPPPPLHVQTGGNQRSGYYSNTNNGRNSNPNLPPPVEEEERIPMTVDEMLVCLDDPNSPDCLRLLQKVEPKVVVGDVEDKPDDGAVESTSEAYGEVPDRANSQSSDAASKNDPDGDDKGPTPSDFISQMPSAVADKPLATQEPTRDDCYGNMLDGRFCTSEMPSISEEPTVNPDAEEDIPPGETGFQPPPLFYEEGAEVGICLIDFHPVDDSPVPEFGSPLTLVSADEKQNTVTFTVGQTWSDEHVMDYINTVYIVPPDGEIRECDQIRDVAYGPTEVEYVLYCIVLY